MNSLIIGPGLPGGMMGSLMADLENNLASINRWMEKRNKPVLTQDDLLNQLFQEVEHIWPKMGYPPLVTPFSQYVKNTALMNVIQMAKGKERWSMVDENTWNMLLGKSGKLLGPLDDHIVQLANDNGREFYTDNPQDLYPNELKVFEEKMKEKGWETGKDDEELMEYAMHPEQYEDFMSGKAKERFEEDLAKRRDNKQAQDNISKSVEHSPSKMQVEVNGIKYSVKISYGETSDAPAPATQKTQSPSELREILSPLEGKFLLSNGNSSKPVKVGDQIRKGDVVGYIESMKVLNAVTSDKSGVVFEIVATHGQDIYEDDVIIRLS